MTLFEYFPLCHWKLFSGFKLNCWVPQVGSPQDGADVNCEGGDLRSLALSSPPWCSPLILPLFRSSAMVEMGHNISWACRLVSPSEWHIVYHAIMYFVPRTVCRQLSDLIVFWSPMWNWYRVRNWIMIFGPATKRGHLRSLDRHFTFDPGPGLTPSKWPLLSAPDWKYHHWENICSYGNSSIIPQSPASIE